MRRQYVRSIVRRVGAATVLSTTPSGVGHASSGGAGHARRAAPAVQRREPMPSCAGPPAADGACMGVRHPPPASMHQYG